MSFKPALLKFTALFLTFPLKANILMQNSTDEQTKCNSRCDSFILHLGHVVVSFVCIELSIKCVKVFIWGKVASVHTLCRQMSWGQTQEHVTVCQHVHDMQMTSVTILCYLTCSTDQMGPVPPCQMQVQLPCALSKPQIGPKPLCKMYEQLPCTL